MMPIHTQLPMAITITILSISRPPLNYAAIINYLPFAFVVKVGLSPLRRKFCQSKIYLSLVRKNTIICLFGV